MKGFDQFILTGRFTSKCSVVKNKVMMVHGVSSKWRATILARTLGT